MTLDQALTRLRDVNEPVARPLRLPTNAQVDAAEGTLGMKFHPDFRRYLLESSDVVYGSRVPVTLADLKSESHLTTVAIDAWDNFDLPRKFLPICEHDGDYFCITKRGEIIFWTQGEESEESWPDLATWIEDVWLAPDEEQDEDEDDEDYDDDEDDDREAEDGRPVDDDDD